MRALSLLAVVAFSALAAAGCGGGDSQPVADGRHFGYVQSVDTGATPATIEIDLAEFLIGEEAYTAAVEDGVIAEGDAVDNDYYVRNPEKDVVTLDVAEDVRVTHVQCPDSCTEGISGELDAFAASFDDPGEKTLMDEYRGSHSQYWITVRDGEVVAIDEQYVP